MPREFKITGSHLEIVVKVIAIGALVFGAGKTLAELRGSVDILGGRLVVLENKHKGDAARDHNISLICFALADKFPPGVRCLPPEGGK